MQVAGISAVVTGAASGLGAATARALADAGAAVVGLDLAAGWERAPLTDAAGGGDTPGATDRTAAPGRVLPVAGDVREPDDVAAAVAAATGSGSPLRIAVNCAGVATPGRVLSRRGVHDLDQFARVVGINLIGTFNVVRLCAEAMAATDPVDDEGQRGLVVNTASVAAFDGQIGQAAYSASKGGVAAMTLPLARDLAGSGIRVMTIAPGILDTPMMAGITEEFRTALAATVQFPRRFGRPDEYAALVLAFAAQDYLNGEVVRLDGGLRMPPR
ncbi:SDR family NAD(P)-dependent oxidoreductase [Nakamurella endophytica]|uniref:3-hydroxy-2-methylbutyryl-CoA dehydrogenase n=1 Tax=Nakamurella endophytica TaxID=1748367 RepID=A0A917T665_9ACTN|nr:SDR family NAD(P)-dependent oxidoreductase [Nakamurella endophytica]GGM10493.1 3-hydroxy-2-methylbutyryl-CoA dehydrogenase [Nakamurella endophytica]